MHNIRKNRSWGCSSSILWKHQDHETIERGSKGGCKPNIIEINRRLGLASLSASGLISSGKNILLLLLSALHTCPAEGEKDIISKHSRSLDLIFATLSNFSREVFCWLSLLLVLISHFRLQGCIDRIMWADRQSWEKGKWASAGERYLLSVMLQPAWRVADNSKGFGGTYF